MNGIEKITEKIIGDANIEAAEIISRADAESASVLDEMEKLAAARANAMVEGAKSAAENLKLRAHGAADLETRKAVLATKQEMIEKAFERALQKLIELDPERYIEVIAQNAAAGVLTGSEEVIMSSAEAKKNGKKMVDTINAKLAEAGKPASLVLSKVNREISGGLILKNGDIETNCTFGAILGQIKPELTNRVAAELFKERA